MRRLLALVIVAFAAPAPATPLEFANGRLFMPVEVNGTRAIGLLDSAAEMTSLDDDLAARLNLPLTGGDEARGTGGTARVHFAKGLTLSAGALTLHDVTAAVLDLDEVASRLIKHPTQLLVGREYFDSGRIRVDIGGRDVSAVPRAAAPEGRRYPLVTRKGVEAFSVSVEGKPAAWADFDLGNGSEILVGKAYAERIGLTAPGRVTGRRSGGGIGGAVERDIVRLRSLRVGGRVYRNVEAAIDPLPNAADLNIGTSILKDFVITTDFPQHALWLEPRR